MNLLNSRHKAFNYFFFSNMRKITHKLSSPVVVQQIENEDSSGIKVGIIAHGIQILHASLLSSKKTIWCAPFRATAFYRNIHQTSPVYKRLHLRARKKSITFEGSVERVGFFSELRILSTSLQSTKTWSMSRFLLLSKHETRMFSTWWCRKLLNGYLHF